MKKSRLPYLLVLLGSMLLFVWGIHRFVYYRSLILPYDLLSLYTAQKAPESVPTVISVNGMLLPVTEASKVNGTWTISPTKANHVLESALPGTDGNIIIFGHNTQKVFGNLYKMTTGDIIRLTTANGTQYAYKIFNIIEVYPSETKFLSPTNTEILTVYTCSGWFDSKRLVLRAAPI